MLGAASQLEASLEQELLEEQQQQLLLQLPTPPLMRCQPRVECELLEKQQLLPQLQAAALISGRHAGRASSWLLMAPVHAQAYVLQF